MPSLRRSQARSVQSTDLVSSPRANPPRSIPGNNSPGLSYNSRQDNAVVANSIYDGAPFEEVANGNREAQIDINNNNNKKEKKNYYKKVWS